MPEHDPHDVLAFNDPVAPTRVEIVIDTDSNPGLLFIWAAARAMRMVEELRRSGIGAELVSLEIDGIRHYQW